MQLNTQQQKAATTLEGAVMVLAGAGSGKSTTLVQRIVNMLASEQMITSNMILAITFTEAGVISMREKLVNVIGSEAYKITIETFHGFCNNIIINNPGYFGIRDFEPITDLENINISYEIIDSLPLNHPLKRLRGDIYYDSRRMLNLFTTMKDEGYSPEYVSQKIDEYINDLPNREEYVYKRPNKKKEIKIGDIKKAAIEKEKEKMEVLRETAKLLPEYNRLLKEKQRYTFSDMLSMVLNAWKDDEFFLLNYQERYQYILVDEVQDTNGTQFSLLNQLISYWDNPNIFVVGDDFQCIYSFNGARIQNMVDFSDKYNPEVIVLNQNYRSNRFILDSANNVISNNIDRLDSKMGVDKSLVAAGNHYDAEPIVYAYDNYAAETAAYADWLEIAYKDGKDLSRVAVLYRKHRQSEELINQLERRGVPYKVKRSVNVVDTIIIKQLLSILEYIVNYNALEKTKYNVKLFEILHYSFWGNDYQKIHKYYVSLNDEETQSRKPKDIIRTEAILSSLVELYHNSSVIQLLNAILNDTGMLNKTLSSEDYLKQTTYLNTFFNWVKTETFKNPSMKGVDIIGMVSNMKDNGLYLSVIDVIGNSEGVNLTTIHGAKGLEWDTVFMMSCARNEWEKSRSGNMDFKLPDTITLSVAENKIESNRRLFYVGMTRAKENLVISYAKHNNDGKTIEPTQFISETGITPTEVKNVDMSNYMKFQFSNNVSSFDLNKEMIKDRLRNLVLSPSAINKYYKCKFTYYIENIVRTPFISHPALIFGNAIHYIMEKYYNMYKAGMILSADKLELEGAGYLEKYKNELGTKEFLLKNELTHKTIVKLYQEYIPQSNKTTLNEFRINRAEIAGVPVKGILDKIEFTGNTALVVDYKTGSVKGIKDKVKGISDRLPYGGDYFRQGVIYKLLFDAVSQSREWRFDGLRFDAINSTEIIKIPVEVTPGDEETIKKLVVEVYNGIMEGDFSFCDDPDCRWCGMFKNNS